MMSYPDSSDNEGASDPKLQVGQDQNVVGKTYHWGKLLRGPIGEVRIFKDALSAIQERKCTLLVIMRHDDEMKHPSLPPEWKVQRILLKKFVLSNIFKESWTTKEILSNDFVTALENLPYIFKPENLPEFEQFFEMYGHGFLQSGYVGGEVYLRVSDVDSLKNIDFESDEDPLLSMQIDELKFRGGQEKYHTKEHLEQWRKSLYDNPVELILDQELDVIFYHDFVPNMKWLRHKNARGKALEEALIALEKKLDKSQDDETPVDPTNVTVDIEKKTNSSQNKINLNSNITTSSTGIKPKTRKMSVKKSFDIDTIDSKYFFSKKSDTKKFPRIGKGYNIFGGPRVKDAVLRKMHIGKIIEQNSRLSQEDRIKVEKLHDHKGCLGAVPGTGLKSCVEYHRELEKEEKIDVGSDSFVLKVARSKHSPTPKLLLELFQNESTFSSFFRRKLKSLPKSYNHDNHKKFESFFDIYGQGLLVNSYHGGEVYFRVTDSITPPAQPCLTSSEIYSALQGVKCNNIKLSQKKCKYSISFEGGPEELKQLAKLPQWMQSLKTNSCQIMLHYDEDMMFYHEMLEELPWLKDKEKRADALQDAFRVIYVDHYTLVKKEQVVQATPSPTWSAWLTSIPVGMWSLMEKTVSSKGPKRVRTYKPFDL